MKSLNEPTTPSKASYADTAADFSPTPLLEAFDNFQGSFFDLDQSRVVPAGELKKLKADLCKQMLARGLAAGDRLLAALPNGPLFAAVWAASSAEPNTKPTNAPAKIDNFILTSDTKVMRCHAHH